ncbi:MAG: hypothetical protein GY795_37025 [Desulfobacterales bacterium]|nr:hypothetical protein [Desulfobacterales bacterium]
MGTRTPFIAAMDPEIMNAIDLYLEKFYPESKKAGNKLAEANLSPSQIRGLEKIIVSASRFSEIINYIKYQAGKDKKRQWSAVAPGLLNLLDQLENDAPGLGTGCTLDEQSLNVLRSEDIPSVILDRLEKLKDKKIITEEKFFRFMEKFVGKYHFDKYKTIISKFIQIEYPDIETIFEIKMRLARGWGRQVVAHFFYKKSHHNPASDYNDV